MTSSTNNSNNSKKKKSTISSPELFTLNSDKTKFVAVKHISGLWSRDYRESRFENAPNQPESLIVERSQHSPLLIFNGERRCYTDPLQSAFCSHFRHPNRKMFSKVYRLLNFGVFFIIQELI